MFVPFGEFKPDTPQFGGSDSNTIRNVLPMVAAYESVARPTIYSDALTAQAQGAFSARDIDGTVYNFAGDATKLYKMASASWSDISRTSGGAYTTGTDEQWNFTQFGRNVYATNFTDAIQTYTMGSSTNFAALAGSPPKARYMGIVGNDFLMLGNLDIGSYTIQWSPQGNPAGTWGTDPATLADKQDLASEWGWIKGIVGGYNGTIFQEHAITIAQFAGSPLGFQFYRVEENKGTQIPGSICKIGAGIFYRGYDGFYIFTGSQSIPIGSGSVDNFFNNDLDFNYLDRVRSVPDQKNMLVYMAYPSSNNVHGNPDRILVYNYSPNAIKRWSLIDLTDINSNSCAVSLYGALSEGYTLDSLDTLNGSIDALSASLDSELYTGGNFNLAAFNSGFKLTFFNGSAMPALLNTAIFQPIPNRRTEITRIRPIIESTYATGTSIAGYMESRDNLLDSNNSIVQNNFSSLSNGDIQVRANGFYHFASMEIDNDFSKASGIELLEVHDVGNR